VHGKRCNCVFTSALTIAMHNSTMTRESLERQWRLTSLTALSALALAACGGGGDSGSTPSPSPAPSSIACPAPAAAAQSTRLIARLRTSTTAADSASAAKSAAAAISGLRMLGVTRFESTSLAKAASGAAGSAEGMQIATYEITEQGMSMADAMQRLRDSGTVDYVEPDVQLRKSLLPNDPYFGSAWHLKNTGQYGGRIGNDIGAEAAWNRATGTGGAVVAVVDDGLSIDHPDLSPNLWRNPREVADGLDNDGNGIVDDLNGADMVQGIGEVRPYFPRVDSDHGTMVSGLIAAKGNNSEGSTGVMWNAQLMALKIEGPASSGYSLFVSDFVKALNYVVAQKRAGVNVRVVNISYGGVSDTQAYRDALTAAGNEGILVVVAAGNDGSSSNAALGYPSCWQLPNVLSVGALTPGNTRASYSNYGSLVNIFAPGEEMLTTSMFSTNPGDGSFFQPGYRVVNGTSFSAPVVSGAAALIMDAYPGSSMAAVRSRMLATATPFGSSQVKLNLGTAIATQP
jgi:Subtilase family